MKETGLLEFILLYLTAFDPGPAGVVKEIPEKKVYRSFRITTDAVGSNGLVRMESENRYG